MTKWASTLKNSYQDTETPENVYVYLGTNTIRHIPFVLCFIILLIIFFIFIFTSFNITSFLLLLIAIIYLFIIFYRTIMHVKPAYRASSLCSILTALLVFAAYASIMFVFPETKRVLPNPTPKTDVDNLNDDKSH